ncbi:uncharacterized protein [Solanum lycopersicum]|uniref:uncharacterized protein n=1 Tax=Solanum lycopersicum TaxID=4081 RepID=UPI0037483422
MQHCGALSARPLVQKKEDTGSLTILCTIVLLHIAKALFELGASIDLMGLSIYKMLGLGDPNPTMMRLLMAYQTGKKTIGIIHDVLIKVESSIFLTNFLIDFEVPIILGRPFLATGHALVDMEKGR